jgi:shikimate kinase
MGPAEGHHAGMNASRSFENLVLGGFMGTGKSSVGYLVATQLHYGFVDTDHLIERRAGRSIAAIFKQAGEAAFREFEQQVVAELADCRRSVIATGGGMTANAENLARLKQHAFVVCLWASPEAIFERVRHHSHRPLLHDPDPLGRIQELLAAREAVYRQADALIQSEQRSVREVAQHVIHQYLLARQSLLSP